MSAFHAADCTAFLLFFEAVVVLVFGLVSVVGALVGEVALFLAVVADLLAVARVFAVVVVVGSLPFWAIRSEVAFFAAAETGKLPSLRLLRLIFLLVLVLAVIRSVAWLLAMIANHPFALNWRTRLVVSLRLFPLVLSIRAVV